MGLQEITINIPDDILKEIKRYRKARHKVSIDNAAAELIRYVLALPPYFKHFDWETAETEADKEIPGSKVESFDSVEEFISDLKK